jgi:hypothetical protein
VETSIIRFKKFRRTDVNHKFKMLSLVFLIGIAAISPLAKADEVNQETVVHVSGPVEVPGGRVLAAGEYVFKLADGASTRSVVQIFNADRSQIMATVLTAPAYRDKPTDGTVITLEERPNGSPEAIGKWFFAGQQDGVEFLYLR